MTDPLDSTATPVHHQYDVNDFFAAVSARATIPSVSYLKAPAVGDAHPGNSDPIDEQAFVTKRGELPRAAAGLEEHRRHHHV